MRSIIAAGRRMGGTTQLEFYVIGEPSGSCTTLVSKRSSCLPETAKRLLGLSLASSVWMTSTTAWSTQRIRLTSEVRELKARFGHVAMVGRSATEVPALTEASVRIALGSPGAGTAEGAANVVLTGDYIEYLAFATKHARRHERVSPQSIVLSGVAVASLLVSVAGGWFSPIVTVLGHELGEFVVIGSSLRLLCA